MNYQGTIIKAVVCYVYECNSALCRKEQLKLQ
jgi:hypothetical protein